MTDYVIETPFPSLDRWKAGNTGIPYVWRFTAEAAGPHVCVTALVHGNEVCGAIAADVLLDKMTRELPVKRGTLSVVFANVAAYESFNAEKPLASRCVDEDFNRLWNESALDGERQSCELTRARELRAYFDGVDHLLDLHSMSEPAPPISLAGDTAKGLALAKALGAPEYILIDSGHAAGKRLRDYAGFGDPQSPKSALLIECGQHWEAGVGAVGCDTMWRFLRHFDLFDRATLDSLIGAVERPEQRVVEISQVITIQSDAFAWVRKLGGMEIIAEAGTLIATDGGREIRTPHEQAIMVMPVVVPKVGQTAVRIGRFVA
jgi:hypothetical protein